MSANHISPAQASFIERLLLDRQAVLQLDGADAVRAFMAAQGINGPEKVLSSQDASRLIDVIKRIPTFVAASVPADATNKRSNAYPGRCHECGQNVPAQAGWIEKIAGRWVTHHHTCPVAVAPAAPALPELEYGLYFQPSLGRVIKVYETQNGRMGVMTTVEGHKGLHYLNGGTKIARQAMADDDLHVMTEEEAAAFGRTHSFCCACGRDLDDDRSIAAGYGPVCAANHNWHYPSYEEAEARLGRAIPRRNSKKAVA